MRRVLRTHLVSDPEQAGCFQCHKYYVSLLQKNWRESSNSKWHKIFTEAHCRKRFWESCDNQGFLSARIGGKKSGRLQGGSGVCTGPGKLDGTWKYKETGQKIWEYSLKVSQGCTQCKSWWQGTGCGSS